MSEGVDTSPTDKPHRRQNLLTGQWTLVAPDRGKRPWLGDVEPEVIEQQPAYDPKCALCPGNVRASGIRNDDYRETFVFDNDFASLQPDASVPLGASHGLLRAVSETGTCRVICFSPRHDLSLASMGGAAIRRIVDLWADQVAELSVSHQWVQVFENRGAEMGASNPHPHGQIWASSAMPTQELLEDTLQLNHHVSTQRPLLLEYVELEESERVRVVVDNDEWLAVVPYWAAWPFETLLLPKRPVQRLPDLAPTQRALLASGLEELLGGYDKLFNRPFPYSMGWHGAPGTRGAEHWQLHAHFYPPLLEARRRKFMVGYELLAETQRDLTPEDAAQRLRSASAGHTVSS